jgi:hypothetical protein
MSRTRVPKSTHRDRVRTTLRRVHLLCACPIRSPKARSVAPRRRSSLGVLPRRVTKLVKKAGKLQHPPTGRSAASCGVSVTRWMRWLLPARSHVALVARSRRVATARAAAELGGNARGADGRSSVAVTTQAHSSTPKAPRGSSASAGFTSGCSRRRTDCCGCQRAVSGSSRRGSTGGAGRGHRAGADGQRGSYGRRCQYGLYA